MKYKLQLAALLLSTALVTTPGFSGAAFAHDMGDSKSPAQSASPVRSAHVHHSHLTKDQAELLQSTLKQVEESNKDVCESIRGLHDQLDGILTAPEFDKDAYLSVVSQIEEKHLLVEKNNAEAFASIGDKFSPKQREGIAKLFSHHMKHKGWKHDGVHNESEHHMHGHHNGHHKGEHAWHHPNVEGYDVNGGQASGGTPNNLQIGVFNGQSDYPPYSRR